MQIFLYWLSSEVPFLFSYVHVLCEIQQFHFTGCLCHQPQCNVTGTTEVYLISHLTHAASQITHYFNKKKHKLPKFFWKQSSYSFEFSDQDKLANEHNTCLCFVIKCPHRTTRFFMWFDRFSGSSFIFPQKTLYNDDI